MVSEKGIEEVDTAQVASLSGKGGGKQGQRVSERGGGKGFSSFFPCPMVVIHGGGINGCLQYPIPVPVPLSARARTTASARAVSLQGRYR